MDITFGEMKAELARLGQWTDSGLAQNVEDAIKAAYREVLKFDDWREVIGNDLAVTVTTTTRIFSLPQIVDIPLRMVSRDLLRRIDFITSQTLQDRSLSISDAQGTPLIAAVMEVREVSVDPASSGLLSVVSSNAGDLAQTVFVRGSLNGVPIEETLTLNGTAAVSTVNSYDRVLGLSKDSDTAGTVTTKDSDTNTISEIGPKYRTAKYNWVILDRPLDATRTFHLTYRRKIKMFTNDAEVSILPDSGSLIVEGGHYKVLFQQRKYDSAARVRGVFFASLADYRDDRKGVSESPLFAPNSSWLVQRNC